MAWVNNSPDGNEGMKTWQYYDNGKLKSEYSFKHGMGYRKDYHENGQLALELNIKNAKLHDCKNYNEIGKLVSTECPKN